ncbi:MAG: penicillin-binding protein 2 [Mariprofundaceae bacterium]
MEALLNCRHRYDRRLLVFGLAASIVFVALFLKLAELQWRKHEQMQLQAEQNRISIVPILPVRGEILDRYGRGLAVNHVSYHVQIIPDRVQDMELTLLLLAYLLDWDEKQQEQVEARLAKSRSDRPVWIADQLQWAAVAPLAARLHRFPGVDVLAGTHRHYPYGELTAHLIGYLAMANSEDVASGFLPMEKVGRSGAERAFENLLHGRLGYQQEEVDALGHRVGIDKHTPPEMGESIRLSIDIDLQQAASSALGDRSGAVVVLDINTGEVLTLLSKPGFDTNQFIAGLEIEQWQAWLQDTRHPLIDRSFQAAYPPASTFKLLTTLAGLDHALPMIDERVYCSGHLELADRNLRCWKEEGHGYVNLRQAIAQSCDVYFYQLGDKLGIDRLQATAKKWGFGAPTGFILAGEKQGVVPGPKWKRYQGLGRWTRGETMITAIGQGAMNATPLQLARFAAAIANGGKLLVPQLEADNPPLVERVIDVDQQHLERLRQAMRSVVSSPRGTAHYRLSEAPWKIAGKTGTAQVIAMAADGDDDEKLLLDRHKDHAWFMGYAPFDNPRIAFAVFVEHGGHGSSAAAPVARAVVKAMAAKASES